MPLSGVSMNQRHLQQGNMDGCYSGRIDLRERPITPYG